MVDWWRQVGESDDAWWSRVLEGPPETLLSVARQALLWSGDRHEAVLPRLCARLAAVPVRTWFVVQHLRSHEWRLADLGAVERLDATQRPWLLGAATMAGNGHVRERAVRALAGEPAAAALRFVVPRCCDWVPQVAVTALDVLRVQLARGDGEALVEVAATAMPWLARRHRGGDAYVALRDALEAPEVAAGLRAGWVAAEPEVRELALGLTLSAAPAAAALDAGLLDDASGRVRFLVAGHLGAVAAQLTDDEVARVLSARHVLVVKRFVAAVPAPVVLQHRQRLLDLACSSRRAARVAAVAALSRAGGPPLPQLRERLAARPHDPSPGLVAALGELGSRDDAAALQPLLQSARPSLLAAAIPAVARLAGLDDAALLGWLSHRSAAVRRAAASALLAAPRYRWTEAVRAVALAGGDGAHAATSLLLRGAGSRSWGALPDLLIGARGGSASARRAAATLRGWCQRNAPRGWLAPDAATLDWLRRLWPEFVASSGRELPDAAMRWLVERLRAAGMRDV